MNVIANKWNDGSGDSINIESPSFQGNQTVKISSPVQKGTSKRSMKFIGKCKKDSSKQVILTVEQEASTYTYDLTLNSDNTEIAAKGGTANITAVLKTYRNGNLISTDNVTPVLSGSATGFSISGVTVTASNRTTIVGTERSITVTGKFSNTFDGQTVSANIVIKQEANSQTLREIINRYTSSNPSTGQNTVKANGGTVWVYTFAIYDYTSGASSETNVSDECTFGNVILGTWDSAKHVWICPSAGTTTYSKSRSVSIEVTWGSKKTTYYLFQEKNLESVKSISGGIYTYGNIVAGTISNKTIPASGGSATATAGNGSQTWNKSATITTYEYTSGATKDVTTEAASSGTANVVPNVSSITATASSKGTTVSAQTTVKSQAVTWSANGKSASGTMYIYQAENKVTNSNYNPRITAYGTPTVSIGSGLTAAGGSAKVSASVTNTETYNALYSSGATGPNQTRSVDGSLLISMTVNGNSRFSLSGNTITHSSMGTNIAIDTVTIIAVIDGDSSKSATASKSITNIRTGSSTSGGIYTYGNIVAGTISNKTIPASGGSATATAGNGSQTWNKSATITTYEYTSGATKDVTTEAASSGTANVVPNVSSITATASSKGTTVSAQTTVKSQAVTWSANGKSASGTMYIYQEANSIDSYNYSSWNIAISANPTTIAASGGTSTITASCMRTKTPVYTSGSTGTATTESATPTLALTTNPGGFTLSGNKLTAANNPIGAKTATVTASYSGATSKSVSVSQAAGPDGIGYMQIQGNGVDHYIFQVGRTPNTRSNDVQTLSEEPAEVATETKSESLFAKIKRIVTNLN